MNQTDNRLEFSYIDIDVGGWQLHLRAATAETHEYFFHVRVTQERRLN